VTTLVKVLSLDRYRSTAAAAGSGPGITVSLFEDFTQAAADNQAAAIARLAVLVAQGNRLY
jgi:hypothetical protein